MVDIRQQESSQNAETRPSQGKAVKDLQHGQVSAAELVQAVHEMLSAAGISMDVEKQSFLQTTLTLQEQLKESQAALLLEQERSDMAAKEADSAKAAWQCRISGSIWVVPTITGRIAEMPRDRRKRVRPIEIYVTNWLKA
ncbi:hypothetical protein AgCh_017243 [Apium graveolens]